MAIHLPLESKIYIKNKLATFIENVVFLKRGVKNFRSMYIFLKKCNPL